MQIDFRDMSKCSSAIASLGCKNLESHLNAGQGGEREAWRGPDWQSVNTSVLNIDVKANGLWQHPVPLWTHRWGRAKHPGGVAGGWPGLLVMRLLLLVSSLTLQQHHLSAGWAWCNAASSLESRGAKSKLLIQRRNCTVECRRPNLHEIWFLFFDK